MSAASPGGGRAQDGRRSLKASRGRPYVRTTDELWPEPAGLGVREIVWRAVEHLAERASVPRESDVRAIALSHAPGRHELGEIDAAEGWSEQYVRWMVKRVYRKLGISGQVALVRQVLAADTLPRR